MICKNDKTNKYGKKGIADRSEEEIKQIELYRKRLNRWHDKQISIMSSTSSLVTSLCLVIVGFLLKTFKDDTFDKLIFLDLAFGRTIVSIMILTVVLGLIILYLRLLDFRRTKDIAKNRLLLYKVKNDLIYRSASKLTPSLVNDKIKNDQNLTNCLGKCTWLLFKIQIILFIVALCVTMFYI